MKKFFIALIWSALFLASAGENLIYNPQFANNFKGYRPSRESRYTVQKGILKIEGNPDKKLNSALYMDGKITLAPGKCSQQKMTLSFEAKVGPLTGALQVAIREQAGKTFATLHQLRVTKWDANTDWKKYTLNFTCHPGVTDMKLVFRAFHLAPGEWILLRNLNLCINKN